MLASIPTIAIDAAGLLAVVTLLIWGIKAVVNVTRVIDSQLGAMHDNTTAVNELTKQMEPLSEIVAHHDERITELDGRVSIIEGARGPRGFTGERGERGPRGEAA